MPRERLMDLEWAFDDISFDLLALTEGPAPGSVEWGTLGDQGREGRVAISRLRVEGDMKQKKSMSVEDLILRRDENLVGVATRGRQVLLVGNALPMMGPDTDAAVTEAIAAGLEYWALSFYEVVDGVIFRRRGHAPARSVSIQNDEFEVEGEPLPFEGPVWDGHTPPDRDEDLDDDDEESCLEERLAKAALTNWLVTGSDLDRFLQAPLTVFKASWK